MTTRADLDRIGTPALLQRASTEGIDTAGLVTRDDLIAALLGETVEVDEIVEPEPRPAPDLDSVLGPDVEPEPEPEPVEQVSPFETDDDGNLTVLGAAEMLTHEHAQGQSLRLSTNHRKALVIALTRLMNYEISVLGSLHAAPEDFTIETIDHRPSRIYAITNISLPDANECAMVVAAGERGTSASPTLRMAKMKLRVRKLRHTT